MQGVYTKKERRERKKKKGKGTTEGKGERRLYKNNKYEEDKEKNEMKARRLELGGKHVR